MFKFILPFVLFEGSLGVRSEFLLFLKANQGFSGFVFLFI